MSIQEVKSQIAAGKQSAEQALSGLAGVDSALDQAIGQISAAAQGSGHASVTQSVNSLAAAKSTINEVRSQIAAAMQSANEYAAHI